MFLNFRSHERSELLAHQVLKFLIYFSKTTKNSYGYEKSINSLGEK